MVLFKVVSLFLSKKPKLDVTNPKNNQGIINMLESLIKKKFKNTNQVKDFFSNLDVQLNNILQLDSKDLQNVNLVNSCRKLYTFVDASTKYTPTFEKKRQGFDKKIKNYPILTRLFLKSNTDSI